MSEVTTSDAGVAEAQSESAPEVVEESSIQEEAIESSEEVSEESGSEEVQEGSEEAPESESSEEGKYEVTVDGEKLMLSREELMKGFQLGAASHKRFQEAAKKSKEAEAALEMLKSNPLEAFMKAGGDQAAFRALAEEYLLKEIEYEGMSPEEKELADLRRYKEEQETQRQTEAQRKQQEVYQKEVELQQKQLTASFNEALEKAGVQPTDKAIQYIANVQLEALESGYELPLDLAIEQYQNEHTTTIQSYLSSIPTEKLVDVIGKEKMKEIRRQELAGLKNPVSRKKGTKEAQTQAEADRQTASDFFASLK